MDQIVRVFMVGLLSAHLVHAAPLRDPVNSWGVTIKGRIVWDDTKGEAPKQTPLGANRDGNVAAMDKEFFSEEWVVNAKDGGIKNVVVWLAPEPTPELSEALKTRKVKVFPSFALDDIHPKLLKPATESVVIEQYCCRFVPHVTAAREGQKILIKNTSPVPHTFKLSGDRNGPVNILVRARTEHLLPNPLVKEKLAIEVVCNIHPWMKAYVRVFDHPYFAVTDATGQFEIKDVPTLNGKLRLFVWQDTGFSGGSKGVLGTTINVKPGNLNLGSLKFELPN